jgi:type I restriction enzyme S subunit
MRVPEVEWPAGWVGTPLSTICDIEIGKTPDRNEQRYWGGAHTWVVISDMKGRIVSTSKETVTDAAITDAAISETAV